MCFECLYVHWFTCYFKELYQYLYNYIVFWYIYECVMTNRGETFVFLRDVRQSALGAIKESQIKIVITFLYDYHGHNL